jgi:hypothetical protein
MALAVTLGAAVIGGVGWFLLGWLVVHEPAGDAAGEGLGVAFGVLIVASVIGAVASRRSSGTADPTDANNGTDSAEDPETRS